MEERLLRELGKSNPWWHEGREDVPAYRRAVFGRLQKFLRTRQMLAIVGLRRVGKTVLMKQLIGELLASNGAKNFLFFSLEERWGSAEMLEDIIYHYLENVGGPGRKYIFLDEVQKAKGWEDVLKRFYDRQSDLKFVVSGSASLDISRSIESLAGRIFDFRVPPLTFAEFLQMNGLRTEAPSSGLEPSGFGPIVRENLHRRERLTSLFGEFLFKGGFPEIALEQDEEIIRKYISNSVVDRILSKDIPQEFPVRNLTALRGMIEYVARETSGILVVDKLASVLGIDKETAGNYLEYLRRAFLVHTIYNHSASAASQLRKSRKAHIALPSIAMALEAYGREVLLHPEIIGKYVESLIAVFLLHAYGKVSFWRTPQKDEVDLIVKVKGLVPIEVKYRTEVTDRDLGAVLKCCKRFKAGRAIIVTRDIMEERNLDGIRLDLVPAWAFLLGL